MTQLLRQKHARCCIRLCVCACIRSQNGDFFCFNLSISSNVNTQTHYERCIHTYTYTHMLGTVGALSPSLSLHTHTEIHNHIPTNSRLNQTKKTGFTKICTHDKILFPYNKYAYTHQFHIESGNLHDAKCFCQELHAR
jgi:hypothetical protein